MKTTEIQIIFQPTGKRVYVLPGTLLLEAAGQAGIVLQTPCGGKGTCGKCLVKISSTDHDAVTGGSSSFFTDEEYAQGYRLACKTKAYKKLTIEIPPESTFENEHKILTVDYGKKAHLNPVSYKKYFKLSEPTAEDARSDMRRLLDSIGNIKVSYNILRQLPKFLREKNWCGTAVISDGKLIALEEGKNLNIYGVAFDIGSTTVVGTLYGLCSGKEYSVASKMNAQAAYGDDVISRIEKVRENYDNLYKLQNAIIGTINEILNSLAKQASISTDLIYEVVLAGNSTMQQIFYGIDPSPLGEIPFAQAFDDSLTVDVVHTGLNVHSGALIYIFPQIGGFVGGDTVAGMVASRLDKWEKSVLFVDIGTNGEIVLAYKNRLLATSTAAGPTFEGSGISQGMRAAKGAIEKVILKDDVLINVIGNKLPLGICGTALIDTIAELLRIGILDSTGRILNVDEIENDLPEALLKRIIILEDKPAFELVSVNETGIGKAIVITQRDIREFQLASGAIRAGINILLKQAGLLADDLSAILLAGAFGNFIRRKNARRVGLLPQISHEKIRFVGNAASLGAKMALLSRDERNYATEIRQKTEHIDLSLDPEFQLEFQMAMLFPEKS
ncbi:MAG: ASKHA domain-containing protein [Verrucomicrobiota bacterium]|nr:ASKHA domain-containing protein [Verrucomicrobiota bacterium]